MPQVTSTDRPVFWAVRETGAVVASAVMEPGGVTLTGLELIADEDENTFLGAVSDGGNYNPLPEAGTLLTSGEIYGYNGGLVIVRQTHNRTLDAPETVPALFAVYRADAGEALDWVANENVYVGTRRMYEDVLYECLQAHYTLANWYPSAVGVLGVLWAVVNLTQEWVSGVAYAVNDEVTYQGNTYRCRQAHTSQPAWTPVATPALWLLL